jgi:hypothetical protein
VPPEVVAVELETAVVVGDVVVCVVDVVDEEEALGADEDPQALTITEKAAAVSTKVNRHSGRFPVRVANPWLVFRFPAELSTAHFGMILVIFALLRARLLSRLASSDEDK